MMMMILIILLVLKTRVRELLENGKPKYAGLIDCIQRMAKEEGIFYCCTMLTLRHSFLLQWNVGAYASRNTSNSHHLFNI